MAKAFLLLVLALGLAFMGCDVSESAGGTDAAVDAGPDASSDAGPDASSDAGPDASADAGADASSDAGTDASSDAGTDPDASSDAGADPDASSDAGADASSDAGSDASSDAGADPDASADASADSGEGGLGNFCQPATRCNELDDQTCLEPCAIVCGSPGNIAVNVCLEGGMQCYCMCISGACST